MGAVDRGRIRPGWLNQTALEMGLLLVILLLLGLPNLVYPFGTDHGEYAYTATEMLSGKVVYRDVFNVKPPVTHWLHAVALQGFGRSMLSIRLLDWFWQAGTGVTIAAITWLLYRRRWAGLLAGVVYGIGYYSVDFWHSAQTDGFVNLPAALSILFLLLGMRRNRPVFWLLSGFMVGFAVLTKYPIGLLLPLILLMIFLIHGLNRDSIREMVLVGFGFGLPLLLFALFAGVRGGLGAFLDIQLGYIPQYNAGFAGDQSYLAYTWARFDYYWGLKPVIPFFVAVWLAEVLLSGLAGAWPREQWVVPLWGIAALVYPAVQNQYYDYHMHALLPPLAIMIAHFVLNVDEILGRHVPRFRPVAVLLGLALPLLLLFLPASPYEQLDIKEKYARFTAVLLGERTLAENYRTGPYGTYGYGFSAQALLETSDFVQQNTRQGEEILVWAFEPGIYFLAERDSASRFIFNYPLYGDFAWPEYKNDFLQELDSHRPALILIAQNDAIPWVSGTEDDSQAAFEKFRAFREFVTAAYAPVGRVAHFTVYARQ